MPKYEILTIVKGDLGDSEANSALKDLVKIINKNKDFKETKLGLKDLAYEIKANKKGWYFQFNFTSNVPSEISEFDRVARLNTNVIRHLIVNLDKDYGANALENPNKVKKSKKLQANYNKKMKKIAEEKATAVEIEKAVKDQEAK